MTRNLARYTAFFLIIVAVAVLIASSSWWFEDEENRTCKDCNVVVLVIDTLRADHLPFFGYERQTAPFLAEIAKRSVAFNRVFSTASKTGPATASLFTSLYPYQHGLITGYMATRRLQNAGHEEITLDRISKGVRTFVEQFKNAGYKTYGISDNLNICKEMGFAPGFDKLETMRYEGAPAVNKILRSWKNEILSGDKYLLYLHYMDPHQPYNHRDPWFKPANKKKDKLINAYDSEISYVDNAIREVYEEFGWNDSNTIFVVTADHGEEFYEHGRVGHGKSLYREVLNIPLLIKAPGLAPRVVSDFVGIIDIVPTLAGLAGLEQDSQWKGLDLFSKDTNPSLRPLLSQMLRRPEHERPPIQSVIDDGWHYIIRQSTKTKPKEQLFNLKIDFAEKHDKKNDDPKLLESLRNLLLEMNMDTVEASSNEVTVPMDNETLEQLKSLGYVE